MSNNTYTTLPFYVDRDESGVPVVAYDQPNDQLKVSLTGSNSSFSWETAASTTEETQTANVTQWFTFANDDPSNDIQINFDATVGSAGTMTIKAGDTVNGMPRKFNVLHVKAVAGTPAFRAWGV